MAGPFKYIAEDQRVIRLNGVEALAPLIATATNAAGVASSAAIAAATAQAAAEDARDQAQAALPYYATVAAGAAAVVAPNTFLSDESGEMAVYDHAGNLLYVIATQGDLADLVIRTTAKELGAVCDGVADDAAILTAAIATKFSTLSGTPRLRPAEIDMGDLTYRFDTTLYIEQHYIQLRGNPTLNCQSVTNAILINSGAAVANPTNIELDVTIAGIVTGDAVLVQGNTQANIKVRNRGAVAGALIHSQASYSCTFEAFDDNQNSATCAYAYMSTPLDGTFVGHNNTIYALGYYCSESCVHIEEEQAFFVRFDAEHCEGPGVYILNGELGEIQNGYTEANGQAATNSGTDTPDDIRIDSAPGAVLSTSREITISNCVFGGELVGGVVPVNVHIIEADRVMVAPNAMGGRIRIESACNYTTVMKQTKLDHAIEDSSQYSDITEGFKRTVKAGPTIRYVEDLLNAGGPVLSANPSAPLRLTGFGGFSAGDTPPKNFIGFVDVTGASNFGTIDISDEVDGNFLVFLTLRKIDGDAATSSILAYTQDSTQIGVELDAAPGVGKTVRINWMLARTS